MTTYVLGVDIGTSSTKAVAYSSDGKTLGHAARSYGFISPHAGYHELDPQLLFEATLAVIEEAVREQSHKQLAGISFSAAMHGLIAVDEEGAPLTNMVTWADLRSSAYAKKLRNSAIGAALYQRTGTPIHPMSPLCKLMWMRDHQPEIFGRAHRFIAIKEYVFFHLFGDFVIDHSLASATGLFDIHTRRWDPAALREAGVDAGRLSRPVPAGYILEGLKPVYARRMGIDSQLPFIAGASDGCLSQLGSNALQHKDVSLTIGTSGAIRVMSDKPLQDTGQGIFNYLLTDHLYIAGGPVNNGGNVLQWFARSFLRRGEMDTADYTSFIEEAMEAPAGSEGLILLPYIHGERAPVWDAGAKGIFYGISSDHNIAHFMRASLEGVAFGLYGILQTLETLIGPVENIYASGGFVRSHQWVSLMADVLGKKLMVMEGEDASATGAAIIGLQALGIIDGFARIRPFFEIGASFAPNMQQHAVYRKNYEVYNRLYEAFRRAKPERPAQPASG